MPTDWIQKLSTALQLVPFEQDWGISNADSTRIDEFIDFYRENTANHRWEHEALAELIFQSCEEALSKQERNLENFKKVEKFLKERSFEFPQTLEYWLSLQGDDWQFPKLLKRWLASKTK